MSNPQFERLLKLEDEEINTEEDNLNLSNETDSCSVPMISDSDTKSQVGSLENAFSGVRHNKAKQPSSGLHFNINGRHIQVNSEQLKYISLITLTIQNAALSLTMRAATIQTERFSRPVAVTIAELMKFLSCVILVCYEEQFSIRSTFQSIRTQVFDNYIDTLKVAVPSFVYYVQNNLLYVGSSHLDAATSQVTYQLKILTTAIFSVAMLNKKLSKTQWSSLIILFCGVALIEMYTVADHNQPKSSHSPSKEVVASYDLEKEAESHHDKPIIGFTAILIACCLSGFAGVYFEKILKSTSHVSLWIRNIQLSLVAMPIGLLQVLIGEHDHLVNKGFFYGFTPLTWLCILLQCQGGLLVAVVVKFANNILKGFATSMAIVIATLASMFLFGFQLTPYFFIGSTLVISSVMMYNK